MAPWFNNENCGCLRSRSLIEILGLSWADYRILPYSTGVWRTSTIELKDFDH